MQSYSLDKDKIKVLLLEGVHQTAVEAFQASGYVTLDYHAKALPEAELCAAIADAHIVGIRSRTQLTETVFAAARKLMAVGCFCIGTNQVDLAAAARRGVPVFNAPFSNTRSVAELVLAEIIMLMRGIPQRNALAHRGGWLKSADHAYEVRGKTLGIVGYGHIGTQVGLLAEFFGMRVLYHNRSRLPAEQEAPLGARWVDKATLLRESDHLVLVLPYSASSHHAIGAAELALMKPTATLTNVARGGIVDDAALAEALREKRIAAAGLDVFEGEPAVHPALLELPNVVLLPHIGSATERTRRAMVGCAVDNLVAALTGARPPTAINPEVLPL